MLIQYVLADPTGNITALVESPVSLEKRRTVAASLMSADSKIEQLGFLSAPSKGGDIALTMAGEEFCGNACLSAAAYYLRQKGKISGSVLVEISGADSIINVNLAASGEYEYTGTVDMPLPLAFEELDSPVGRLSLLRFPGINHAIAPTGISAAEAEKLIVPLACSVGGEAFGLMLLDEELSALSPLVYVPGAGSLFWERSCASGTSAVGAYLALRSGENVSVSLKQPGGSLSIAAEYKQGKLARLSMGGKVRLSPSIFFPF